MGETGATRTMVIFPRRRPEGSTVSYLRIRLWAVSGWVGPQKPLQLRLVNVSVRILQKYNNSIPPAPPFFSFERGFAPLPPVSYKPR